MNCSMIKNGNYRDYRDSLDAIQNLFVNTGRIEELLSDKEFVQKLKTIREENLGVLDLYVDAVDKILRDRKEV
jgi:hypothetical protein